MTEKAEKIQLAADMIVGELAKQGNPVSPAVALHLARRLYEIWERRHEVRNLPAGEVAQRMRERYQQIDDMDRTIGDD